MVRSFLVCSVALPLLVIFSADARCQGNDSGEVAGLIEQGRQFYFRHRYPEAVDLYRRALERSPQNVAALYELAWAYFETGEHTRSLEAATEASMNASEHIDGIYALISLNYYYTMTVATFEVELNERTAEEVVGFRKAARTAEDGDERLFRLGLTYTARNEPGPAVAAYIEALQVRPEHADAHWELGKCFEGEGKYSLAVMAYTQALLNAPEGVFAARILTMLENALARAGGDTTIVLTTPQGKPSALARRLKEVTAKPDTRSLADTAACNHYLPWFRGAIDGGYQDALANSIYRIVNHGDARKWTESHREQLDRFLAWSGTFRWTDMVEKAPPQEEQPN